MYNRKDKQTHTSQNTEHIVLRYVLRTNRRALRSKVSFFSGFVQSSFENQL